MKSNTYHACLTSGISCNQHTTSYHVPGPTHLSQAPTRRRSRYARSRAIVFAEPESSTGSSITGRKGGTVGDALQQQQLSPTNAALSRVVADVAGSNENSSSSSSSSGSSGSSFSSSNSSFSSIGGLRIFAPRFSPGPLTPSCCRTLTLGQYAQNGEKYVHLCFNHT